MEATPWYPIHIGRGGTYDRTWEYEDGDGNPIDVSANHTSKFVIRGGWQESEPVILSISETVNGNGSQIFLGNGTVRLLIAAADSVGLSFTRALHTLWLFTDTGATKIPFIRGSVLLEETVEPD